MQQPKKKTKRGSKIRWRINATEKDAKNIKVIRFNADNNETFTKQIDEQFGYLFK